MVAGYYTLVDFVDCTQKIYALNFPCGCSLLYSWKWGRRVRMSINRGLPYINNVIAFPAKFDIFKESAEAEAVGDHFHWEAFEIIWHLP